MVSVVMQQVQFSAFQSPADKLQFRQSIFVLFIEKAGALRFEGNYLW